MADKHNKKPKTLAVSSPPGQNDPRTLPNPGSRAILHGFASHFGRVRGVRRTVTHPGPGLAPGLAAEHLTDDERRLRTPLVFSRVPSSCLEPIGLRGAVALVSTDDLDCWSQPWSQPTDDLMPADDLDAC